MFENIEAGVVSVAGSLYVKTPEALKKVLQKIKKVGYEIDDLRKDDYRLRKEVTVEQMEKRGYSMWYAKLDVQKGKCGSCGGYISTRGIRSHGHKCELCGEVTYYKIIDGSIVRFSFNAEGEQGMADVTMTAKHWDTDEGFLYLYPEVKKGLWLSEENAQEYLDVNSDKWEEVEQDGQKLIRLAYPVQWSYETSAINPSDIRGHYHNHQMVQVWEGKEYGEYDRDFPLPTSFSIYEAWHWAPLPASPIIHEKIISAVGQVSDKGWYHQDGRSHFQKGNFEQMGKFVRHFTDLDADSWDEKSKRFNRSGPGGIDDIAKFCHPDAVAENKPNIGNVINGFSKALSGESLTDGEVTALQDGLADREIREDFAIINRK